jgi:adenine-specific DNA-methyltransferase
MDEVFGSENFASLITFSKTSSATTELLPGMCDYVLLYAKAHKKQNTASSTLTRR